MSQQIHRLEFDRMRIVPTPFIAALFALCTFLFGQVAQAQLENRLVTVQTRPRPETDAIGIRSGGFMILPTISISESYDDNILASDSSTPDDLITSVEPAIIVKSNWTCHAVTVTANAGVAFYASNSNENYQDYAFSASGRFDALRDTYLTGGMDYASLHESRSSADDTGGDEPGLYTLFQSSFGVFNRFNRFSLSALATFKRYDFDDVVVSGPRIIKMIATVTGLMSCFAVVMKLCPVIRGLCVSISMIPIMWTAPMTPA